MPANTTPTFACPACGKVLSYSQELCSCGQAVAEVDQWPVKLYECGCCGQFHPENTWQPGGSANYKNDCRYDANRFNSAEDFETRTGSPAIEIMLDEQEEMSDAS